MNNRVVLERLVYPVGVFGPQDAAGWAPPQATTDEDALRSSNG
jgi:hypothetical protein